MRTRRLLRNVWHGAIIMSVSSLDTRLIHISPSYCRIFLFVWNCSRMGTCLCKSTASKTFNLIWIIFKKCLFVAGNSGFNGWAQVSVCVLASFIFPNWQPFVWNYFRMRTVHWTGIHIHCSTPAVFNVRSRLPEAVFPLRQSCKSGRAFQVGPGSRWARA